MEHLAPLQSRLSSVIVTTPQAVALTDAMKGISFTRAVLLPILGLIENMSGYVWSVPMQRPLSYAPVSHSSRTVHAVAKSAMSSPEVAEKN